MSGIGNSLLEGNNIGDAIVGGGLAGATNGAATGTMLDDRVGTGRFKFGIGGRKQAGVMVVVDFGPTTYGGAAYSPDDEPTGMMGMQSMHGYDGDPPYNPSLNSIMLQPRGYYASQRTNFLSPVISLLVGS
jgi:hypothetical protein